MEAHHVDALTGEDVADAVLAPPPTSRKPQRDANNPSSWGKVGRNEPCPCGSGKKYKQCHGMVIA
jgi:preprotein translocase subunit SecA